MNCLFKLNWNRISYFNLPMENQPQNPEFRNNPENSTMYLSICWCMALHISMASTDPFFILRSSTRQLSHLSWVLGLFEIKSFRLKIFWRKIIIFWYKNNRSDIFSEKKTFKATLYTETYCFYRGTCIKPLAFWSNQRLSIILTLSFIPQRLTFNSKP